MLHRNSGMSHRSHEHLNFEDNCCLDEIAAMDEEDWMINFVLSVLFSRRLCFRCSLLTNPTSQESNTGPKSWHDCGHRLHGELCKAVDKEALLQADRNFSIYLPWIIIGLSSCLLDSTVVRLLSHFVFRKFSREWAAKFSCCFLPLTCCMGFSSFLWKKECLVMTFFVLTVSPLVTWSFRMVLVTQTCILAYLLSGLYIYKEPDEGLRDQLLWSFPLLACSSLTSACALHKERVLMAAVPKWSVKKMFRELLKDCFECVLSFKKGTCEGLVLDKVSVSEGSDLAQVLSLKEGLPLSALLFSSGPRRPGVSSDWEDLVALMREERGKIGTLKLRGVHLEAYACRVHKESLIALRRPLKMKTNM